MAYVNDTYGSKGTSYSYKADKITYKKLEELYKANGEKKVYTVHALYLSTKSTNPHPVAIVENAIGADLPAHLMEQVKTWRADAVLTDLINKGLVGFTIYTYQSDKYKKTCYSIDLVDIDAPSDDDSLPFPVC